MTIGDIIMDHPTEIPSDPNRRVHGTQKAKPAIQKAPITAAKTQ